MLILFEYRGVLQCAAMSFANTKLDGASGRALAPLSDGAKSMPPRYYSHVNEKLVCVYHLRRMKFAWRESIGKYRRASPIYIGILYRNPSIQ